MRKTSVRFLCVGVVLWASSAAAQPLTADRAVEIALRNNAQVVGAEAALMRARGAQSSAFSNVLPQIGAGVTRTNAVVTGQRGGQVLGAGLPVFGLPEESESHATIPTVSATWNIANLSTWANLSAARSGLAAARQGQASTRQLVAFNTRQQFYEVVRAVHLASVQASAAQRARDDERRVRALFEVGSVSRSDVLRAHAARAQSQLDSLTAVHNIAYQRILLADQIGVRENELGTVDTTLTATATDIDEATILDEATRARPDLQAAELNLRAARADVRAAQFGRFPFITANASVDFDTDARSTSTFPGGSLSTSVRKVDRDVSAAVALNWNILDELTNRSRVQGARAALLQAQADRDVLRRNLEGDVRRAVLGYREAVEREVVARRGLASAEENFNLTQQKYNVGSATILDLVDAQVQLQTAQSNVISALAAIRVAEAALDRVRGRGL